jgi:proline iminopeptidase
MAVVEQRIVDLEDAQLEVYIGGTGDLVICNTHPSYPASAPEEWTYPWNDFMTAYRVVHIYPRGFGNSSPVRREREMTFSQLVDDIDAVRAALGIDRWVFCGNSSGGCIALLYALRYPQSLRGLIVGFSVSSGPAFITDPDFANPLGPGWTQLGDGTWINLSYRRRDLWIQLRANLDELGVYDVSDRLGEIQLPTLVIAGAHDTTHPPRHAREIHAGIAGSEFLLLEHSGHGVGEGASEGDAAIDRALYRATVQRFLAGLPES